MNQSGEIRAKIYITVAATVARYNGANVAIAASDADTEIEVRLEATRTRTGLIEDMRAWHNNEEVALSDEDKARATEALADCNPEEFLEPDIDTDGLTIGSWGGRMVAR